MYFPGRHAPRSPRLTFLFVFLPDQWGIASSTPELSSLNGQHGTVKAVYVLKISWVNEIL